MKQKFYLLLALMLITVPVFANDATIAEFESLRNSLPSTDPSRKELTLRLADLYFFAAVDVEKQANLNPEKNGNGVLDKKAKRQRLRSLNFYREVLKQFKLSRTTELKVHYQVARLLDHLGRIRESLPEWNLLRKQQLVPKIRREALLKLAELAEKKGNAASDRQAEFLYKEALQICQTQELCSFVHYRLGWVYRNQNRIPEALKEIRQSLWDSKGQVQEEVLRDFMGFLTLKSGNGEKTLLEVEQLAKKLRRPELIENLAFGFYAAGNRTAGTRVLALVAARDPKFEYFVRLLEEYYGQRSWDKFREVRERIDIATAVKLGIDERKEVEKILRRLVVQLDGEREGNPTALPEFLGIAEIYSQIFPKQDLAFRMMRSWLSAEKDMGRRMQKSQEWLTSGVRILTRAEEIELREIRSHSAQELQDTAAFRIEMDKLASLYKKKDHQRKARYVIAYSLYKETKLDLALPLFQALAKIASGETADKWAMQSQNLALDIYNQKKDYTSIMRQADLYLNRSWPRSMAGEIKTLRKIRDQADFQWAVSQGDTPEALTKFFSFCNKGEHLPQSCANAKKVAVRLKDHQRLIQVLEKLNSKDDLINEYEVSGYFVKAANLLIQRTPLKSGKWNLEQAIKISLLYELEGDFKRRDLWLMALQRRYKRTAIPADREALLYQTWQEAGLLTKKSLKVRWPKAYKLRLANFLEVRKQGSKKTRSLLMAEVTNQGPMWEHYVRQLIIKKAIEERGISFYGRRSKNRFKRRLAKLRKWDKVANKYLEGLPTAGRYEVLTLLFGAYKQLQGEILATPIPEGLEAEAMTQLQNALQAMSTPFGEKAAAYHALLSEELGKSTDMSNHFWQSYLDQPATILPKDFLAQLKLPEPKTDKKIDLTLVGINLERLHNAKQLALPLQALRDAYVLGGSPRIASYYTGRLKELQ